MKKTTLYQLTSCAIMAALLCILAPVSVPVGPVPVTLATLVLYLSVWVLDTKGAVIAAALYLLLGAVGLPVFAGYSGGIAPIIGPTGGYLIGYLLLVLISGLFNKASHDRVVLTGLGMVAGTVVLYAFGTIWFIIQTKSDIIYALTVCVLPFIGFDLAKIVLACAVGRPVSKALKQAALT